MTKEQIAAVLESVHSWPEKDQEELAEFAREIVARRKRVYVLSEDERAAIDKARKSRLLSDDEMKAFWKRLGIK